MIEIVQEGTQVLRDIAHDVEPHDITDAKIQTVLKNMSEVLASQPDGVAIAAPQIGVSLRIFIASGERVFGEGEKDRVFINPQIIKTSRKKEWMDEGCLSVRFKYGEVERAVKATVTAYDETGKAFTLGGSGLLAQIFQHEVDHLNGILFIDKAETLREASE